MVPPFCTFFCLTRGYFPEHFTNFTLILNAGSQCQVWLFGHRAPALPSTSAPLVVLSDFPGGTGVEFAVLNVKDWLNRSYCYYMCTAFIQGVKM